MPLIDRTYTFAEDDNGKMTSALDGSQYEYLPWDAEVEIAVLVTAAPSTGANAVPTVTVNVFSGSDLLLEGGVARSVDPNLKAQYPYDFLVHDMAAAGERIGVNLVPAGAAGTGTVTVRVLARLSPVIAG